MKIFHIITLSALGGAQSVVANLASEQSKENEVYIISGIGGDAWKYLNPNINIIIIPQLRRDISILDFVVLIKLLIYRIKYKPHVVHLHSSKIGLIGRLAFSRKKTIYTVHGFDSMRIANRKLLFLEKLLKNKVFKIVGVSMYDLNNLNKEGIINNTLCIYNGIDDKSLTDKKKEPKIETALHSIKENYSKIIISIARDSAPKRIDLFFEVAKLMPDLAFVWIGNDKNYINKPSNVFLFGQLPNASLYLPYADVFMLASDFEGLPISIIEAFSFCKPVVASNVGGISELLDNMNGFAVENTVEEFVSKIDLIILNKKSLELYGSNARSTYLNKFTLSQMASAYQKLYIQITEKSIS